MLLPFVSFHAIHMYPFHYAGDNRHASMLQAESMGESVRSGHLMLSDYSWFLVALGLDVRLLITAQ
jgi:hypothetical protein